MPGKIPDTVWLYRIVHYTNLVYILQHGMFTKSHPKQDPSYVVIGDNQLIGQRQDYPVGLEGMGSLGDYVRS
ncbi:MAG: DarT ssDNA thymidine ADP-ribosyltransferase family protein, partial [Saprospiraceae bacterium]